MPPTIGSFERSKCLCNNFEIRPNQGCRYPGHHLDRAIEDAELVVIVIFTNGGEFKVVSLKGEEFCLFGIRLVESDDDGREGISLCEGGEVIAVKPYFRL